MDEALQPINVQSAKQKMKSYSGNPLSLILAALVGLSALITVLTLVFIIGYILIKGIPNLSLDLFQLEYNSENVSMFPSIINTICMTVLSLLIAGPLGILAAVYLVEYAKKGNKLVSVIRITAETLTGIPSIVYGLFGMLFFVTTLKWGFPCWQVPLPWLSWYCRSLCVPQRKHFCLCRTCTGKPVSDLVQANSGLFLW